MNLTWPTGCDCEKRKRVTGMALVSRYRVSRVTPGAPASEVKASRAGIVRDMVRMRRQLMIEGQRSISAFLDVYFRETIFEICERVELAILRTTTRQKSIDIELGDAESEAIWKEAIEEVLGPDANIRLVTHYTPIVQSIAAKAHARTALFLGEPEAPAASVNILRRSQAMAQQVTRINETTRERLQVAIQRAVDAGEPISEVVRQIKASVPEIQAGRIPTVARTEVGNAIDGGTKEAMKNSKSIATVCVIGCTAVEPNIPTFDGRPTCNITGVPVSRVDELRFHPNHSGCLVVETFITDKR